jgi:group I intron endonuclease
MYEENNQLNPWIIPDSGISKTAIGFTYIIINQITSQSYIGLKLLKGKWEDYFGSSKDLKEDIKKYGKHSFTRGIIRFFDNEEDLEKHEINLQIKFDVLRAKFADGNRMFYNRVIYGVGFSNTGRSMSEKAKLKISDAVRERLSTEEGKQQLINGLMGREVSEETRKKISKSTTGRKGGRTGHPASDETKKKSSISNTGKKRTDETKKNISEALSNPSKETRERMSKASTGRIHTDEAKKAIGKASSARKRTPVSDLLKKEIGIATKLAMNIKKLKLDLTENPIKEWLVENKISTVNTKKWSYDQKVLFINTWIDKK